MTTEKEAEEDIILWFDQQDSPVVEGDIETSSNPGIVGLTP